jgi:hypothetical protein
VRLACCHTPIPLAVPGHRRHQPRAAVMKILTSPSTCRPTARHPSRARDLLAFLGQTRPRIARPPRPRPALAPVKPPHSSRRTAGSPPWSAFQTDRALHTPRAAIENPRHLTRAIVPGLSPTPNSCRGYARHESLLRWAASQCTEPTLQTIYALPIA